MTVSPQPFFRRYTQLVTETDLAGAMRTQLEEMRRLLGALTEERANRVDAPYTWSIKQVLQHVIDAERVFGYRALRFSRADPTPLPGFDENAYAGAVEVQARPLSTLLEEFDWLRRSHVLLFEHLAEKAWSRKGTASGLEWTVDDLARAIIGHARHHLRIVEQRLSR